MPTTKSELQKALELAGFTCSAYSGRGMYGKECLGVGLYGESVAKMVAQTIASWYESCFNPSVADLWKLADCLSEAKTDSLGTGEIVYFPGVEYAPPEKCFHENQYLNDRQQFVCRDCDEELGR